MSIKHLFGFPIIEDKSLVFQSDVNVIFGDLSSYIQIKIKLLDGKEFDCLLSDFPKKIQKKILERVNDLSNQKIR